MENTKLEWFKERGYNCHKHDLKDNIEWEAMYYQRRVLETETEAVCELNEKLHINITESKFRDYPCSYEIYIRAERKNKWCDFKFYSISVEQIEDELPDLERQLIAMFNSI